MFTFLDIVVCNRSMRNSGSPCIRLLLYSRDRKKERNENVEAINRFLRSILREKKKKGKIFDSKIIRIRVAINALNILAEKGLSYLKATLINPAAVAAATAAS